jgi:hypothetical protein
MCSGKPTFRKFQRKLKDVERINLLDSVGLIQWELGSSESSIGLSSLFCCRDSKFQPFEV